MGNAPSVTQASGAPLATLTTTAETAALTSTALAVASPGQGTWISGTVTGATGAGATAVQVRVRAGSGTGGSVIGLVTEESAAASSFYSNSFSVLDTALGVPSAPAGTAQYTVTVQQVGASGNGTVTLASICVQPANAAGA